jgi:PAS domain S-box-containing protein
MSAHPFRTAEGESVARHMSRTHDTQMNDERAPSPTPAGLLPAELLPAEVLLSAIVDSSDDAIISKNLDGVITSWNHAAERMFGYTAHESVGRPVTMLIPADRLTEEVQILERIRRGESVDHFETIRVCKNGTLLNVSLTISPIKSPNGFTIGASKIVRDITRKKAAERAIQRQQEKLRLVNQIGTTLAAERDPRKLVQAVTDAGRELSGAAFGAFFYNAAGGSTDRVPLFTLSGFARNAFETLTMPCQTPLFAPTFEGSGVVRLADVQADSRHRIMLPSLDSRAESPPLRSYLAVAVKSRTGEVLGGLFFGHPEPGVFSEESEELMEAIASQAGVAIDNARLHATLEDDLDRLKRTEEALQAAYSEAERQSRMKDEFLATLSHELRTPLQSILGWTEILRSDDHTAEDLVQGLETIDRNASAQRRIIDDLLDLNRILSGKVRLDVQTVNLAEIIEQAIDSVKPAAQAKGIRLQPIIDPLARPVAGDPNRLQQVFWNLLSNALKFTGRGGRVQVRLERVNSHLEITVADNGEGIDPNFLPFVFDRFRQADGSTTRRHGGLGLGLAIVKNLVELHGGMARVRSPGVGKGATFSVTLPLAAVHSEPGATRRHPAASQRESSIPLPQIKDVSVLVVDDEPDARMLIARLLVKAGATVHTASSAAEAIEQLRAHPPHVLISDLGMPDTDGYGLVRAVRAMPASQGGHVPAIALTAYSRMEDRVRAIAEGFQMHIAKPCDAVELLTMVASLAGK